MSEHEDQLERISQEARWSFADLDVLEAPLANLGSSLGTLIGESESGEGAFRGRTDEALRLRLQTLQATVLALTDRIGQHRRALDRANHARNTAILAMDRLPSALLPSWVTDAVESAVDRTATVTYLGTTVPVGNAVRYFTAALGSDRAEAAQRIVEDLRVEMDAAAEDLLAEQSRRDPDDGTEGAAETDGSGGASEGGNDGIGNGSDGRSPDPFQPGGAWGSRLPDGERGSSGSVGAGVGVGVGGGFLPGSGRPAPVPSVDGGIDAAGPGAWAANPPSAGSNAAAPWNQHGAQYGQSGLGGALGAGGAGAAALATGAHFANGGSGSGAFGFGASGSGASGAGRSDAAPTRTAGGRGLLGTPGSGGTGAGAATGGVAGGGAVAGAGAAPGQAAGRGAGAAGAGSGGRSGVSAGMGMGSRGGGEPEQRRGRGLAGRIAAKYEDDPEPGARVDGARAGGRGD